MFALKLSVTVPACPRPRACALGLSLVRVRSRRLRCIGLGLSRAVAPSVTGRRMAAEPVRFLTKSLLGSRFVHPDHLGTPRVITASTALAATTGTGITSPQTVNKAVWRWDSDPFGSNATANSAPNENPNTLSQVVGAATVPYLFGFDLAFPGQKRDRETGKHYNYSRDYDPQVGRYTESDPIWLRGGLNLYGYVFGKPISMTDFYGMQVRGITGWGNWCGKNWSGGKAGPVIPKNPAGPVDSVDACCMTHDYCYAKFECYDKGCQVPDDAKEGKKICDREFVACLDKLIGKAPSTWPMPPQPEYQGYQGPAMTCCRQARFVFGAMGG
jgi:RHS repeat-associated protein